MNHMCKTWVIRGVRATLTLFVTKPKLGIGLISQGAYTICERGMAERQRGYYTEF